MRKSNNEGKKQRNYTKSEVKMIKSDNFTRSNREKFTVLLREWWDVSPTNMGADTTLLPEKWPKICDSQNVPCKMYFPLPFSYNKEKKDQYI